MLGNAEQVPFRIGQGGPLHVCKFPQDIPLECGTETQDALDLRLPGSPRNSQVHVAKLVASPGTGTALEEHAKTAWTVRGQIDAVPVNGL